MREERRGEQSSGSGGTHRWVVAAPAFRAKRETRVAGGWVRTPGRGFVGKEFIADFRAGAGEQLQKTHTASAFPSIYVLRGRSIRKKIIGHTLCVRRAFLAVCDGRRDVRGAFTLLEQQPRDRGVGLIGQPLVHQRADLLTQIGGVRQTGQFKTLERILRSGQQKIPRWLVSAAGHGGLQIRYGNGRRNNNAVIECQEYATITTCGNLWKTRRPPADLAAPA